jgi:hypothetical protein
MGAGKNSAAAAAAAASAAASAAAAAAAASSSSRQQQQRQQHSSSGSSSSTATAATAAAAAPAAALHSSSGSINGSSCGRVERRGRRVLRVARCEQNQVQATRGLHNGAQEEKHTVRIHGESSSIESLTSSAVNRAGQHRRWHRQHNCLRINVTAPTPTNILAAPPSATDIQILIMPAGWKGWPLEGGPS